jgi:hypothetical protein
VQQAAVDSGGTTLAKGAVNWWRDVTGQPDPEVQAQAARFAVGRDVAVTPGQVVHRNRLIELIRYAPQTKTVHPEPLLVIPSWIMKYYILDLSPHNSLARYLVQQGHTVYMLSWRNPDAGDHDLSMDDYLDLGVFDALRAIGRLHGAKQAVHAMGYCLGGTLLAIAAAAIGRHGGCELARQVPPLRSLTLLAAQTDFSEPGELGLFIDESQVGYLDENYFAYQEDADFCMRARAKGWKVYYVSEAQIMHYGGLGGSMVNPRRSIIEWHKAYFLLFRKHFAKDYFFLFNWFYYLAMLFKLFLSLLGNLLKRGKFGKPRGVAPTSGIET